ncbi:MAG: hypothetical protein IPJ65_01985 [Archangiaceae bacterium]|nr:hypothetical protein [Archangiaceae bacterium]
MTRSIAVVWSALVLAACSGGGNGNTGGGSGGNGGNTAGGSGGATAGGTGGSTAGGTGGATAGGTGGGTGGAADVLLRPDRSSTIAITTDDAILVAVNPDNDTVSIFNAATKARTAVVSTGANTQPVSVTIHPDKKTAFVVLRKSQELIKINDINTITPTVNATRAAVGSEPTGVALTPTGATAVVTNFGEDRVSFVTTATMAVTHVAVGPNPRAVAITNNNDGNDADETAYVTLFYGTPSAEASDTGRTGKVIPIPIGTKTPGTAISLAPITDVGTASVACSPNQLFGITINAGHAYVTHVCASPAGPVNPLTNLFSGVSVIDLPGNTENTTTSGTTVMAKLLSTQDTAGTSSLLGVPVAIEFKAPGIGYLVSQAADVVQRIVYNSAATPPIKLGTSGAFAQININPNGAAGGTAVKVASGAISAHSATNTVMYVNNWLDRSVTVIDLNTQAVDTVIRSEALPASGSAAEKQWRGKRFYFTGFGRWSTRGVNSCGSCHPDGLSDNITWVFAAGPRQTTPMDGTFSKTDGEQRALNWTAIFDEVHDFELNARGTAGGVGAIVSDATLAPASRIDVTVATSVDGGIVPPGNFTRHDNLSGSMRQLMVFKSALQDWDEIHEFSKTIRANKKPSNLESADVTAGAALFSQGKCQNCHGGAKWTVSRVSFTPSPDKNGTAAASTAAAVAVTPNGLRTQALTATATGLPAPNNTNFDANKVSVERGLPDGGVVGPERITCVLRRVGTFDINDAIEKKADGTQSQGIGGFNPPSLLGMATSAPYFHNGKAGSLNAVLTNAAFNAHLTAGNPNFILDATQARQLEAFLKSIDDATTAVAPDGNTDTCAGY